MEYIQILLLKTLNKLINIFGFKGGNIIGKIAYKLNPNMLEFFKDKINGKIIATTATNGKTMTNNLIAKTLEDNNYTVISNKDGNNMDSGILSVLIKSCKLNGKIDAPYLCFEVDESYVPIIFKTLKLDTLVVGNFFRDQLDRNGEVEHLILNIENFLKDFDGNLILNGNDPNVFRLKNSIKDKNKVFAINVDKYKYATKTLKDAGEGKYCPNCKAKLDYEYYQYSHIGKFNCPKCNFGSFIPYVDVKNVDLDNRCFTIDNSKYDICFNNIYTIYNFALAYAVAKLYKLDKQQISKTFKTFKLNNGRMEELIVKGNKTIINLAKNPAGCNVSLRLLSQDDKDKELLFVLNDKIADGKDVSWIYDIDFEDIANNKSIKKIVVTGTRPYDIAIRIKNSFYPKDLIFAFEDLDLAINNFFENSNDKYVICNYTALSPTRDSILKFKELNNAYNANNTNNT